MLRKIGNPWKYLKKNYLHSILLLFFSTYPTSHGFFQLRKQIVVAQCRIWRVRWIIENLQFDVFQKVFCLLNTFWRNKPGRFRFIAKQNFVSMCQYRSRKQGCHHFSCRQFHIGFFMSAFACCFRDLTLPFSLWF